jgi:hypothetical protein
VFLYFNVCLSVKLDSFSCSLTSISFLHNIPDKWSCSYKQDNKLHQCSNLHDKTLDQQSCSNQPHNIYLTSDCIPTNHTIYTWPVIVFQPTTQYILDQWLYSNRPGHTSHNLSVSPEWHNIKLTLLSWQGLKVKLILSFDSSIFSVVIGRWCCKKCNRLIIKTQVKTTVKLLHVHSSH